MAKKRSSAGTTPSPPSERESTSSTTAIAPANGSATPPPAPLEPVAVLDARPVVRVKNKGDVKEVKGALDEVVRTLLTSPPQSYTQSHRHQDVKLALGWTACIIALGTVGWSTRVKWEESKTPLTFAVIAYMLLSTIQMVYAYYVEKESIFVGRRKALVDGRIETSHMSISAKTSLPKPARVPIYTLTLSSSRSTNAGKSLLARLSTFSSRAVGEFVDVEGVVDVKGFEAWVVGLIEQGGSEGKTD